MMIFFPSFLPRPVRQFFCVLLRKIGVLQSFPRTEKLRLREATARAWITAATAQARIELLQKRLALPHKRSWWPRVPR